MAERLEKRIDHQSDQQHAGSVPEIRVLDTVKYNSNPMKALDEDGGSQAGQYPKRAEKQKGAE
jgi:hypothetical protein